MRISNHFMALWIYNKIFVWNVPSHLKLKIGSNLRSYLEICCMGWVYINFGTNWSLRDWNQVFCESHKFYACMLSCNMYSVWSGALKVHVFNLGNVLIMSWN